LTPGQLVLALMVWFARLALERYKTANSRNTGQAHDRRQTKSTRILYWRTGRGWRGIFKDV